MMHEDDELDDMQGMDEPEETICPHCGGTGSHPYLQRFCSFCGGSGTVDAYNSFDNRYQRTKYRVASAVL